MNSVKRPLLNYFGGKWRIAPWIISYFPEHEIYCESFGGSASILMRKPRSKREIINEVDQELVNLYFVARDHGRELQEKLMLTPHSRWEYRRSMEPTADPVEKARRTIVRCYFGIGDSFLHNHNSFRNSKDSNTCVASSWKSYWECFEQIIVRLQGVTIDCLSYKETFDKYDSKNTLFYLDPPYPPATRSKKHNYRFDWSDFEHMEFLNFCRSVKGKVIISGYDCDIYESNLSDWNTSRRDALGQKGTRRTEVIWMNF